jgi:F-type H+-transporting ATPase subunit delta
MEELIAKRYIKAIKSSLDVSSMKNLLTIFATLAESFKDNKFINIIDNPNVNSSKKLEMLLESVKPVKSKQIDNLIKLLVEKNRINIIPALAEGIRKDLTASSKVYEGHIYSDGDVNDKVIKDLSSGLSKKYDSKISLIFIKSDFNGIKVDVEDLGIEINFSKSRINSQIIEHIVKAI